MIHAINKKRVKLFLAILILTQVCSVKPMASKLSRLFCCGGKQQTNSNSKTVTYPTFFLRKNSEQNTLICTNLMDKKTAKKFLTDDPYMSQVSENSLIYIPLLLKKQGSVSFLKSFLPKLLPLLKKKNTTLQLYIKYVNGKYILFDEVRQRLCINKKNISNAELKLFPNIKDLTIENCNNLNIELPQNIEHLELFNCPQNNKTILPANIKKLSLRQCPKQDLKNLANLEELSIDEEQRENIKICTKDGNLKKLTLYGFQLDEKSEQKLEEKGCKVSFCEDFYLNKDFKTML